MEEGSEMSEHTTYEATGEVAWREPSARDLAYQHVDTMVPRADGKSGPHHWWHGWALNDSFVAGIQWRHRGGGGVHGI